jgi:hypothetical protein
MLLVVRSYRRVCHGLDRRLYVFPSGEAFGIVAYQICNLISNLSVRT